MKAMNDLHKKNKRVPNGQYIPGTIPHGVHMLTTRQLYYKKLAAYLLLLYQSYLKGETELEPEIKMALWRMVKFNKEFPIKIRMTQLDYLSMENDKLDAEWDEAKDILFPNETLLGQQSMSCEREKIINGYKAAVSGLLQSQL